MLIKIRKYIGSPIFTDGDKSYFEAILRILLLTLLILSPIILVTGLLVDNPEFVWAVIITDAVVLGALWLLHRGFTMVAGWLLPLVLLLLAMYFILAGHGLNDTALLILPLVIMLAGLLLGRAGLVLFTLVAVFYTFFIFYLQANDLIITCCNYLVGVDDAVAITVILAATAALFNLLSSRLSSALTQTQHNQQTLRESEAKLRLIYDNAYDGISIYEELPNRSHRLIDCNERYAEIAGRSKAELLGIGNTSLIQKKVGPDMNLEEILRVRRENTPYHGLFSWIRPDGKENVIEYSVAPVQVGNRSWTIGLDRDITAHKQITEKLRENEARLQTIINHIPFDMWVCDAEDRYIMQSATSFNLAGDLLGKTVADLNLPLELHTIYMETHGQALSGETVRRETVETIKGETRYMDTTYAPICDGEHILGFIGIRVDMTERMQAAESLRLRNAQLDALRQIGLELAGQLSMESLLQTIAAQVRNLLTCDRGGFHLYRPDQDALELVVKIDPTNPLMLGSMIKPGDGLVGRVWQTGQPMVVNRYRQWSGKSAPMTEVNAASPATTPGAVLGVPVRAGGEALGVLVVGDEVEDRFTEVEVELLSLFAAQAALSIHNARLHEQTQHHAAQLEQEVAERKRVEAALRTSDERYRTFISQTTEGIYRYEFDPGIAIGTPEAEQIEQFFQYCYLAECNDSYARMYGYATATELTGTRFGSRFPRQDPQNIAAVQALIRSGYRLTDIETREIDSRGNIRDFSNNLVGIVEQGNLRHIWGTQRDITERKQAEQALKEYSERLEEMVAERTRALETAQERLVRQEKLAFLGQLAGSVGHELRNPLGVISNAIYFLNMVLVNTDETVKEYLNLIADRVNEADKIVADLLNLSRNRTADRSEVLAGQLIDEVLTRHSAPEAVTIALNLPPNLPALFIDAQQIRQVLANLVSNAYQAMPNGGELTIAAQAISQEASEQGSEEEPPPTPYSVQTRYSASLPTPLIKLTITDTGHGMAPATMAKIFEPLFTTKAKGIGLGLAVSKNLVEVNGGNIKVESSEGQGSTFTVVLPTREKTEN